MPLLVEEHGGIQYYRIIANTFQEVVVATLFVTFVLISHVFFKIFYHCSRASCDVIFIHVTSFRFFPTNSTIGITNEQQWLLWQLRNRYLLPNVPATNCNRHKTRCVCEIGNTLVKERKRLCL